MFFITGISDTGNQQTPLKEVGFLPLTVKPSPSSNASPADIELLLADGKCILFHQGVSSDYLKAIIS